MGLIFSRNKEPTGLPAGGTQLELFQAARTGDCTLLARLLECGADVNACDPWDTLSLYYACLGGHCEAAQMLLEAGADYSKNSVEGERCYRARGAQLWHTETPPGVRGHAAPAASRRPPVGVPCLPRQRSRRWVRADRCYRHRAGARYHVLRARKTHRGSPGDPRRPVPVLP